MAKPIKLAGRNERTYNRRLHVSILMAVYHRDDAINFAEALHSLAKQTLRANELVLVEDGPLPIELENVIESYREMLNIKSVKLPVNRGLAVALNSGLQVCAGELIVRADADDVSVPERLETQVDFMATNPGVAASSSFVVEIDQTGLPSGQRKLPERHRELVKFAKYRSPLSHPAAIFRKDVVCQVGCYPEFKKAQDYSLWVNLILAGEELANIPQYLVRMRAGGEMLLRRGVGHFVEELKVFQNFRKSGFLTRREFVLVVFSRFILRIPPLWCRRLLYKLCR